MNLVPSERPDDLYQRVADSLTARLAAESKPECVEIAKGWLAFGVDRKLAKRPVMVLPYGGSIRAARKYIYSEYTEGVRKGRTDPWAGDDAAGRHAVNYLAAMLWEVLATELPAAINAMKWLQTAAGLCNKAGLPIRWESPTGFVVHQAYQSMEDLRVDLYTPAVILKARPDMTARRQLTFSEPTDELDARQQRQGVSPNFVHSIDAAHLVRLVELATASGIHNIAVVHDSYGTLATQTEAFFRLIRQAFVDIYATDLLGTFRQTIVSLTGKDLDPAPVTGDYDVREIMESDYAFA